MPDQQKIHPSLVSNFHGRNLIINGQMDVAQRQTSNANPAVGNKHYDEIMRQVAAGTITIADAD